MDVAEGDNAVDAGPLPLVAGRGRRTKRAQSQYDAGQRQVMDVVGVYETWVSQEVARIALKYEMAGTRLEMARELGLLADGGQI